MSKLLWNYKTEEFDSAEIVDDKEAVSYIPDTDFAKSAFRAYRKSGFSVDESISKTIKLFIFIKGDII